MASKRLSQAYQVLDLDCVCLRPHTPISSHTVLGIHTEFLWFLEHATLTAISGLSHPLFLLPTLPFHSSFLHLAISKYCYLSLDILFSERSHLMHSAKQLSQKQPISPGTVLVYLSIHLFFIQNTLHIRTYAIEYNIFHSMLYPYIYVVQ